MSADLILGKGQGTPMLKDGIHCIGVQVDEESEASDWQGFDWNEIKNSRHNHKM